MRREKKEIRKLLLGKIVLDENGRLAAPEPGVFHISQGVQNGAGAVRFLGISCRERCYETDLSREEIREEAERAMMDLGRVVFLREQPEQRACLVRHLLTRPVLLTFLAEETGCSLKAWTGRGLLAWLLQRRAMLAFERAMGDLLRGAAAPVKKKKEKKRGPAQEPEEQEAPAAEAQENPAEETTETGPEGPFFEETTEEEPAMEAAPDEEDTET